jgi:ATP-dependent protease HslVU (ClpYQ) peptidase subunit
LTIVCAIHAADGVWIGSDSRCTDGGRIVPGDYPKWLRKGGLWFGVAGWAALMPILEGAELPAEPVAAYLELRHILAREGWKSPEFDMGSRGGPPMYGFDLLIASPAGVWNCDGDGSIIKAPEGEFVAIGSGSSYAYGAWHALHDRWVSNDSDAQLNYAIEAAIRYDTGCGGEIFVKRLGDE